MRWDLDAFIASLASVSDSTAAVYRRDVAAFQTWVDGRGLESSAVTRRNVRSYLAWLHAEDYAASTIARKASSLRRYFRWAHRRGLIEVDPTIGLQAKGGTSRLPRVLRSDELTTLLDEPRPHICLLYTSDAADE